MAIKWKDPSWQDSFHCTTHKTGTCQCFSLHIYLRVTWCIMWVFPLYTPSSLFMDSIIVNLPTCYDWLLNSKSISDILQLIHRQAQRGKKCVFHQYTHSQARPNRIEMAGDSTVQHSARNSGLVAWGLNPNSDTC